MNPEFDDDGAPRPPVPLAAVLHDAAATLQQSLPPPALKARVLAAAQAAVAAQSAVPQTTRRPAAAGGYWQRLLGRSTAAAPPATHGGRWAWSGAAACAVVLVGSALLMLRVPPAGPFDDGVRLGGVGGGFLPLVPPERWPQDAAPAWLVSTELPGERLAALGLPYDPAHAGDSVRAELLLHPSGEVLAVRFLH